MLACTTDFFLITSFMTLAKIDKGLRMAVIAVLALQMRDWQWLQKG